MLRGVPHIYSVCFLLHVYPIENIHLENVANDISLVLIFANKSSEVQVHHVQGVSKKFGEWCHI